MWTTPSAGGSYVDLSTNQASIAGNKTFTGNTTLNNLKLANGTQATGSILTSDANGNASWSSSIPASTLLGSSVTPNFTCMNAVGSYNTFNNPTSVAVSGNYAYVTTAVNYLQVINISNPSLPTVMGSVVTGTNPQSVAVSGNYAYVVNYGSNTLQVINVSTPSSPSVVGSVSTGTGSYPVSVAVSGNYAYVANYGSGTLQVINVSTPTSPSVVGYVSTGTNPSSVAINGNYAYVVNYSSSIIGVINISSPLFPYGVGAVSTGTNSYPNSVAISGNYAYVGCGQVGSTGSFKVVDISSPTSPTVKSTLAATNRITSVAVNGNYAFLGTGTNLEVVDVSSPTSPSVLANYNSPTYPASIAVLGNYAYEVGYNGGSTLQVVNLTCTESVVINSLTGAEVVTPNTVNVGFGGGNIPTNVAVGLALSSNTTGTNNIAFGSNALGSNTTGFFNTANGINALLLNTTGGYNTAIGFNSLATNTTGTNNTAIGYNAGVASAALANATAIGNGATVTASNYIQLGNTSVTRVNSSAAFYGLSFNGTSDVRLKRNIQPLTNSLNLLMKLRPVSYEKKASIAATEYNFKENGFIAQELRKVFPTLVDEGTDKDKLLTVNYIALIPVLTKAIQEQQAQIAAYEARIKALEEKMDKLINVK